jgi:hypothetical protein
MRTRVPPAAGLNVHSTSIPLVIPPTCRKRIDGATLFTDISESHHVGQLNRIGPFDVSTMWNGR